MRHIELALGLPRTVTQHPRRLGWVRDTRKNKRGKPYAQSRHVWKDDETGELDTGKIRYFKNGPPKKKAKGRKSSKATPKTKAVTWKKPRQSSPWSGGKVDHQQVYSAPVDSLHVDPARFQYKLVTDRESGVTDELKEVQSFNPDLAGVISVWQDPASKKTYVVNGHHRVELAKRTGHPSIHVRYLRASNAQEARATGALINIAEGRGTAVDAAKFMRDTGATPEDFRKHGISLKGKVAADASHLRHLGPRLFDQLAQGLMDERTAVAVTKHLHSPREQEMLFGILEKREDQGRPVADRIVEEMAREIASTPKVTRTEVNLFGSFEEEDSLFVERADIKSHVRRELQKAASDFTAVASRRRADRVTGSGNVLNVEQNKERSQEYQRMLNAFDLLANRSGEVSQVINDMAGDLFNASTKNEQKSVREKAVAAIEEKVREVIA